MARQALQGSAVTEPTPEARFCVYRCAAKARTGVSLIETWWSVLRATAQQRSRSDRGSSSAMAPSASSSG